MATQGLREDGPSRRIAVVVVCLNLAGCCGLGAFARPDRVQTGWASYYGREFDGRKTANGETYDMHALTAAHRSLPFGTRVKVTDIETGRSVVVRINDRGPWARGRILDLSFEAARRIGMIGPGTARVRMEVLGP